jgi:hypothetical protein
MPLYYCGIVLESTKVLKNLIADGPFLINIILDINRGLEVSFYRIKPGGGQGGVGPINNPDPI